MMTHRMRRTTGAGFTEKELRYLMERSSGRLAFVCSDMQAHIMPVSFEFDGSYFYLSGWNLKYSERFQDVSPRSRITLLVDDVDSSTRWVPRGVEITGEAESRVTRDFAYGVVPIEGKGSGLIIDSKGYVITNNHVIDGAAKVQIHLKDGRSFVGEVVGSDPSTDIAVIHVEAENLPAATLGDSEQLKVGQLALAIGNTLGLQGGPTVSLGVVSALGRPLPGADFIFEGLIQTDTAINPGNSGGPLADISGNVIGMNTAMIPYAQGVGFAIPVNTIKWVMQQIREKGRVVRPWLGIYGTTLNDALARRYDLPADFGVLVVEVDARGPAYRSGLRVGDVIIGIGSQTINQMKDVLSALSKHAISEEVDLRYIRTGTKRVTRLLLQETPLQTVQRR